MAKSPAAEYSVGSKVKFQSAATGGLKRRTQAARF